MEELCLLGLAFRDTPVTFHTCNSAQWVNITKLSYGIPWEAISEALRPFRNVISVKMDTFHNVYIGTRNVLMEISHPIPSRVKIADHWCDVFYSGQQKTCVTCHKTGHSSKDCPDKRVLAKETGPVAVDHQTPSVNNDAKTAKADKVCEENITKQPATLEGVTQETISKPSEEANGENETVSGDPFDCLIATLTEK